MKYKNNTVIIRRVLWCVFVILLFIYVLNFYLMYDKVYLAKNPVNLQYTVIHLDFKGAPPKLEYLTSILPKLKRNGANALLVEYEHMFPFKDRILNLSATNSYKRKDLEEFLSLAVKSGFEIIPLVQTFGHMEFVLKLEEFKHLREDSKFIDSICPSDERSLVLIEEILTQIISFHNEISPLRHIHIGCDEVFSINVCDRCIKRQISNMEIFIGHIEAVSNIIAKISPTTKILIWDDMMRNNKHKINWNGVKKYNNIFPVYWDYDAVELSHASLYQYSRKFNGIWIASAFKGADGVAATLPDLNNRLQNHLNWMKAIRDMKLGGDKNIYKFMGIILTGWSRYSHMDPLVELLPIGFPSLILSLITVETFKDSTVSFNKAANSIEKYEELIKYKFVNELNCIILVNNIFENLSCDFEGADLYDVVKRLMDINKRVNDGFYSDKSGLASKKFYLKLCFYNRHSLSINWLLDISNELSFIKKDLRKILTKYYDTKVIKEYVNLRTQISETRIEDYMDKINMCENITSWPRGSI